MISILLTAIAAILLGTVMLLPRMHHQDFIRRVIPFEYGDNHVMLITALVDGNRARLLFDTGASHCLFSNKLADKLGGISHISFANGFNGIVPIRAVHKKLSILGVEVEGYACSDIMPTKCDGIIGADVLRQFATVQINFPSRTITLEKQ